MTPASVRQIERECLRLIYAYTHLADFGRASSIVDLFTHDGVFDNGEVRWEGREALARGFGERERRVDLRTRHVCTNPVIDVKDQRHAAGVIYLTLYRHSDPDHSRAVPLTSPAMVGSYHDDYRRTRQGWRLAQRIVQVPFRRTDA